MATDPRLADAWARLPDYLGSHVLVSITALAIGLGVSLPLAMPKATAGVARRADGGGERGADHSRTGAADAVLPHAPGARWAVRAALRQRLLGARLPALGAALALYSMLPVLRNTVVGLNGVDAGTRDAARGAGAEAAANIALVELPLAMPVIMAGIRTAAVWVIGTATLSTPIGQTSLGNYIFAGLQTQNWVFVLFGCVAAAALALSSTNCSR